MKSLRVLNINNQYRMRRKFELVTENVKNLNIELYYYNTTRVTIRLSTEKIFYFLNIVCA